MNAGQRSKIKPPYDTKEGLGGDELFCSGELHKHDLHELTTLKD